MALRSMSPRFTGALIGLAVLSACGSNPPALTSASPPSSGFSTKQFPPGGNLFAPGNLLPFSYLGTGYGPSIFGLGASPLATSLLAGPFSIVPPTLIPFKAGAIGSALPFADACSIGLAVAAVANPFFW
jgi:hypothetical protein